ncbi:hypothetical protein DFA_03248 [Cavenderia fasciculata]|uniref:Uncharacterized protein n=1 Tax=Cavenderia fasciculata TaxID=261658 RepID=F4PH18_CACFS|nr:uncharacterized protein DFA_03248 [Cavenderia fasciculata]EGG25002.1 hypothetical protein DFA_03248 [Cavenderia fasciculata]|eukprot:XP_004362853.1 hypothetical protein DFA_03248 [Cavenderia fasciculata]
MSRVMMVSQRNTLIAILAIAILLTILLITWVPTLMTSTFDCNDYCSAAQINQDSSNSGNYNGSIVGLTTSQLKMVSYVNQSDRHYDRVLDFNSLVKKHAYVFYITQPEYFCVATITTHRLRQWTDVDIVFVFVESFVPDPFIVARLDALPNIKYKTFSNIKSSHDSKSMWVESFNKFHVFRLTEYDRLIYLDADTYILRSLDHLFALPDASLAAPRAYWFKVDKQPFLTDTLMVLKPSMEMFYALVEASTITTGWDMDVVNAFFIHRNDFLLLPGIYGLLNFEFGIGQNHYFGADYHNTYREQAYIYHYSSFKPWKTHNGTDAVSGKGALMELTWYNWKRGHDKYCLNATETNNKS